MKYSKQLLSLAPQNSYAFQVHGSLLALQGDVLQAKNYFTQAIKLNKNNFQAVMYLARTEALLGNVNTSIKLLNSALSSGPNSALYIELGDVYQGINDIKTSMTWYQKALAHNPSSLLALNKIVASYKSNNQLDDAITITKKYLESFGDNAQAYKLLAQLFQQKGWYKKAISQMNHFVKLSTDHAEAHYQLAQLQIVINKSDQAILSLQKSISWQKDFIPSYLLLFSLYNKDKNEQEALGLIQDFSSVSQDKSLLAKMRGDVYWSLSRVKKALDFYQQSYHIKPNREALLGIYRIYRINQQFSLITDLLSPWVDAHENDFTIAISLAENHHQMGDLLKANTYYETLLKKSSDNPVILNNAAIVNRELKQYERAAELSEMAYQLMPKNVKVLDTKAWIEFHRGNTDVALALLRKANTLNYEDAEVKYHLAVTLSKLNRFKEAKKHLKESVKSQQNFPEKSQAKSLLATW